MKVLFLTMSRITSLEERGIYTDLMRKFRSEGHELYIVAPLERRFGVSTHLSTCDGVFILGVQTLNVQKTNVVEKGLGQFSIEFLYKRAIKKHFADVQFNLILYSTPPITLVGVVKYVRRICPGAVSYLLLKDIFPQNAVDMQMMAKCGVKAPLYWYFRHQELKLYKISDHIGCMSPANVRFLLENNSAIDSAKLEVNPNSIELIPRTCTIDGVKIREKYGLPVNIPVFIYGGNLGVPQGIPFLIECLNAVKNRTDCHFAVVGTGTCLPRLLSWYNANKGGAVTVMEGLPKAEYDELAQACQVGLVFLDYRFTIPNYPSRLLSYMEYKMPVIFCSDPNCDAGAIAEKNGYGFWCPSNNVDYFVETVDRMLNSDMSRMGENGYEFLKANYQVENSYKIIMSHFKKAVQV